MDGADAVKSEAVHRPGKYSDKACLVEFNKLAPHGGVLAHGPANRLNVLAPSQ